MRAVHLQAGELGVRLEYPAAEIPRLGRVGHGGVGEVRHQLAVHGDEVLETERAGDDVVPAPRLGAERRRDRGGLVVGQLLDARHVRIPAAETAQVAGAPRLGAAAETRVPEPYDVMVRGRQDASVELEHHVALHRLVEEYLPVVRLVRPAAHDTPRLHRPLRRVRHDRPLRRVERLERMQQLALRQAERVSDHDDLFVFHGWSSRGGLAQGLMIAQSSGPIVRPAQA